MTQPCGRADDGNLGTAYKATVNEPEVRYRHGFKVIGCEPRLLGTALDRAWAENRAQTVAAERSRKISALGGPAEVEWWVQRVTITAAAEYDAPEGALLTEDETAALLADPR